ncbi:MAG: sensor histidine kinase [Muribaculaceae bacterium]|nr:sensor histidine kinase [Muribaculaceae bacterium]
MKALQHPRSLSRHIFTAVSHLLFIIIIFILPELVMAFAMPHRHFAFYPGFYLKTLIFIAAFYINYFLIIDSTIGRSGARHGIVRFMLWNLLILAAGMTLDYFISRYGFPPKRGSGHEELTLLAKIFKRAPFLIRDAVMLILTIGLAVALRLSAKWKDIDRSRQEMLASQRATELDSLKSQLNPHFLFNSLNTIYALVDISPDDAKSAVHRLSGLLRYMLYEDMRNVRLRREADFIENYVALMRLRLSNRPVTVDIDLNGHDDVEVPPLLFIPLIENAFKYGNTAPGTEPIAISLKADKGEITCCTSNSYAEADRDTGERRSSGIGLANLRRRLQLIYGSASLLRTEARDGIYRASLTIHNI